MKKLFLSSLFSLFTILTFSQNKEFFKDERGWKETDENHAKYVKLTQKLNDSITYIEFLNVQTQAPLWKIHMYKGHLYGKCQYFKKDGTLERESNYDFDVKYGSYIPGGYLKLETETGMPEDISPERFQKPLVKSTQEEIYPYILKYIQYPQFAVENGISGKVYVQLTIDKNGKVDNILIKRGVHESLDWEVCRLMHDLPEIIPAKLDGKNIDVHITLPVTFRLQE
jgi:protein TonB